MLSLILDNLPFVNFCGTLGATLLTVSVSGEKPGFRTEQAEGQKNNRAESHGRLKIVSVISICKNPKPM